MFLAQQSPIITIIQTWTLTQLKRFYILFFIIFNPYFIMDCISCILNPCKQKNILIKICYQTHIFQPLYFNNMCWWDAFILSIKSSINFLYNSIFHMKGNMPNVIWLSIKILTSQHTFHHKELYDPTNEFIIYLSLIISKNNLVISTTSPNVQFGWREDYKSKL